MHMDQIDRAAAAAGAWWAELLADEYEEHRKAFGTAVASLVARQLRGEVRFDRQLETLPSGTRCLRTVLLTLDPPKPHPWVMVEFDYDPDGTLASALEASIPGIEWWQARRALPQKHSLRITATELDPKEGYGRWVQKIAVPTA
jgi:hypothetical protein